MCLESTPQIHHFSFCYKECLEIHIFYIEPCLFLYKRSIMTSPQPLPIPFFEISEKEAIRTTELSLKEFLELVKEVGVGFHSAQIVD